MTPEQLHWTSFISTSTEHYCTKVHFWEILQLIICKEAWTGKYSLFNIYFSNKGFSFSSSSIFHWRKYECSLWLGNVLNIARRNVSVCLLMATWSLSVIVISHAYTGTLISNLLAPNWISLVNSLEELTSSSFGCVVRRGTNIHSTLMLKNYTSDVSHLYDYYFDYSGSRQNESSTVEDWRVLTK